MSCPVIVIELTCRVGADPGNQLSKQSANSRKGTWGQTLWRELGRDPETEKGRSQYYDDVLMRGRKPLPPTITPPDERILRRTRTTGHPAGTLATLSMEKLAGGANNPATLPRFFSTMARLALPRLAGRGREIDGFSSGGSRTRSRCVWRVAHRTMGYGHLYQASIQEFPGAE